MEETMKEINRDSYLKKLIDRKENNLIKIITGIKRSGKSYLLDPIYKNYLLDNGVDNNHIIKIDLDLRANKKFLDPDYLDNYVRNSIRDEKVYYCLLDEIQNVPDFESVLNGFLKIPNLDVYVTGSNSKFLSSDIITEFRGRGDEIRVYPLTFSEFLSAFDGTKEEAWNSYIMFGGLPLILNQKTDEQKRNYLISLFNTTYLKDTIERNNINRVDVLDSLINLFIIIIYWLFNKS